MSEEWRSRCRQVCGFGMSAILPAVTGYQAARYHHEEIDVSSLTAPSLRLAFQD